MKIDPRTGATQRVHRIALDATYELNARFHMLMRESAAEVAEDKLSFVVRGAAIRAGKLNDVIMAVVSDTVGDCDAPVEDLQHSAYGVHSPA